MTILKQYRLSANLSQTQMAKKLGIGLRAYRNYEYGQRKMPYEILAKFLWIRNLGNDKELAMILKETYKMEDDILKVMDWGKKSKREQNEMNNLINANIALSDNLKNTKSDAIKLANIIVEKLDVNELDEYTQNILNNYY